MFVLIKVEFAKFLMRMMTKTKKKNILMENLIAEKVEENFMPFHRLVKTLKFLLCLCYARSLFCEGVIWE